MNGLSAAGIVEEFIEQWRESDMRDQMPEPMAIDNGPVVELTLIAVYERHQQKGLASRALRVLTSLCDADSVTIRLVARALPPELSYTPGCPASLATSALVAWYRRHGFIEVATLDSGACEMERKPRPSLKGRLACNRADRDH